MARYIDADKLIDFLMEAHPEWRIRPLRPTADVMEVVRCKDCIHYWKNWKDGEFDDEVAVCLASPKDDAFCSEGERREDG